MVVIHHINRIKYKNQMIVSISTGKAFYKTQHHFIMKILSEIEIGKSLIIKVMYEKSIPNIILNSDNSTLYL
jgi:type I site-specific restriction endonuclease